MVYVFFQANLSLLVIKISQVIAGVLSLVYISHLFIPLKIWTFSRLIFKINLQVLKKENSFISVVVVNFNATIIFIIYWPNEHFFNTFAIYFEIDCRYSNWWPNNIGNACGIEIDVITSSFVSDRYLVETFSVKYFLKFSSVFELNLKDKESIEVLLLSKTLNNYFYMLWFW